MRYIIETVKDCADCYFFSWEKNPEGNNHPFCEKIGELLNRDAYPAIPDTCPLPKEKP